MKKFINNSYQRLKENFESESFEIAAIFLSTVSMTIILILLPDLSLYWDAEDRVERVNNSDQGRNERSTPRSFILPASPAVAIIQEKKERAF